MATQLAYTHTHQLADSVIVFLMQVMFRCLFYVVLNSAPILQERIRSKLRFAQAKLLGGWGKRLRFNYHQEPWSTGIHPRGLRALQFDLEISRERAD